MFGVNLTSKVVLGFAAGVVIGACGYKLVSEKKINFKALDKIVHDFGKKSDAEAPVAEAEVAETK